MRVFGPPLTGDFYGLRGRFRHETSLSGLSHLARDALYFRFERSLTEPLWRRLGQTLNDALMLRGA